MEVSNQSDVSDDHLVFNNHVLQKLVLFGHRNMFFTENTRHTRGAFGSGGATWASWQRQGLQDTVLAVWEREKERETRAETDCL